MRLGSRLAALAIAGAILTGTSVPGAAASRDDRNVDDRNKERCAGFGFQPGTDAFADCVMRFSLKQEKAPPPDRETLLRRYRDLSLRRQGDSRYPVCSAGMMDNELDTSLGKWVGPSCQLKAD